MMAMKHVMSMKHSTLIPGSRLFTKAIQLLMIVRKNIGQIVTMKDSQLLK